MIKHLSYLCLTLFALPVIVRISVGMILALWGVDSHDWARDSFASISITAALAGTALSQAFAENLPWPEHWPK